MWIMKTMYLKEDFTGLRYEFFSLNETKIAIINHLQRTVDHICPDCNRLKSCAFKTPTAHVILEVELNHVLEKRANNWFSHVIQVGQISPYAPRTSSYHGEMAPRYSFGS